jgi:prepilin-type N-terminal cleavage/methylation domain-containing protein
MHLVKKCSTGFTLVEMLIVIALIGILAAALVEKMDASLAQTRDARRKSELIKLQNALTTYYARNGHYPITVGNNWYGEPNSDYVKNGGDWIPGLAPTYIPKLPADPHGALSKDPGCIPYNAKGQYLYKSLTGENFKLLNYCGVEVLPVQSNDPFKDGRTGCFMVCSGGDACDY